MYFLLAGVLSRLRFLTVGLSFVLTFIGAKMIAHKWVDIPEHISLMIVGGIILLALAASLLFPYKTEATHRRTSTTFSTVHTSLFYPLSNLTTPTQLHTHTTP